MFNSVNAQFLNAFENTVSFLSKSGVVNTCNDKIWLQARKSLTVPNLDAIRFGVLAFALAEQLKKYFEIENCVYSTTEDIENGKPFLFKIEYNGAMYNLLENQQVHAFLDAYYNV